MSKNVAVFVDVANLYYAARGQDVDVDYVALLKHATKGRDLIRAYAYSGLDPENENQKKFLDFLTKNGYRVVAKDIRKFGDGRVKANLDIELVVDLFRLADRMDVAVIVSGDGDFAPAIRALQDVGVRCEVISFKPNTSSDLFAVADEFHDAMKISAIGRQKDTKGVGAPEMPAKEVNPDVGFREASPSVAAAALAAARGNGDDSGRSRGSSRGASRRSERPTRTPRGGTSRTPVAPEAEAVAEAAVSDAAGGNRSTVADESASDAARRRRRRGGRGRGRRGRRGGDLELGPEPTNGEPAEIGWQELDSLDDLDERGAQPGASSTGEIAFEEADAATLAELGLTEQPPTETAGPAPETATPKPRARRAPAKAATASTPTRRPKTETDAAAAPKSRGTSRTTRTTKATASKPDVAAGAAAGAAAEAPKKPARKPRATKTEAAPQASADAAAAGSDEGIWKRFTSGRTTRTRTPEPPSEA